MSADTNCYIFISLTRCDPSLPKILTINIICEFIPKFFTTMQLVLAGNDTQGMRYGTIETPEKYFLTWKEEADKSKKEEIDLN